MTPEERDRLTRIEANYSHALDSIDELRSDLAALRVDVGDLVTILKAGRGAWALIAAAGAGLAALVGAIAWSAQHLRFVP